ncbi:DUF4129 domain-containing protein [Halosolutus amylolyticus]|uniref:DUF4129 domain-containing protein n=1 Tax=Halosolutus amylolyticus TaxID=2932267 RepID=A0ABD5PUN6_9EURY|nr:DUF4129 domain-containing protein [Halosolutus amylolyticus]
MTGTRRVLFALGCVLCLLAVATALPAADPRLDPPGDAGGEPTAGDWDSIDGTPEFDAVPSDDRTDENEADDGPVSPDIEIEGAIEPGNEVRVDLDAFGPRATKTIHVNGDAVAETDEFGRADVVVPYAEEMTVTVPEDDVSRTIDVETDATIETHDGAVPDREFELSAAVGSTPVTDATVFLDGESVATTDEDGRATVTLPETAGPAALRVERGPVEGEHTVDVAEPTVRFVSPLLFPGSPAPVQVSADGDRVPDATVSLADGEPTTTGDDGRARVWLPIEDEATVTAEVGAETATATVGNLYRRLAALVVLVPGFVIGGSVTYLRFVASRERRRGAALAGLFVTLADLLAGLSDAFATIADLLRGLDRPSLSLPGFTVPQPGFGWTVPSVGPALASFGRALGTLPSLGSLLRSSGRDGSSPLSPPSIGTAFGRDDAEADDPSDAAAAGPELASEPLAPRGPRAEIRAAWHAVLDRLAVEDRETATPGAVARRALGEGFPAEHVTALVTVVREVEYGGREPSPERVARARAAASELLDHDPDTEGST